MARPKKPADEKLSGFVFVSFKPIEHEALKRRAEATGLTLSSLTRQLVLKELEPEKVGGR